MRRGVSDFPCFENLREDITVRKHTGSMSEGGDMLLVSVRPERLCMGQDSTCSQIHHKKTRNSTPFIKLIVLIIHTTDQPQQMKYEYWQF